MSTRHAGIEIHRLADQRDAQFSAVGLQGFGSILPEIPDSHNQPGGLSKRHCAQALAATGKQRAAVVAQDKREIILLRLVRFGCSQLPVAVEHYQLD